MSSFLWGSEYDFRCRAGLLLFCYIPQIRLLPFSRMCRASALVQPVIPALLSSVATSVCSHGVSGECWMAALFLHPTKPLDFLTSFSLLLPLLERCAGFNVFSFSFLSQSCLYSLTPLCLLLYRHVGFSTVTHSPCFAFFPFIVKGQTQDVWLAWRFFLICHLFRLLPCGEEEPLVKTEPLVWLNNMQSC